MNPTRTRTREPRRTVITGIGVATPHGLDVDDLWAGVRIGKNALGPADPHDPHGPPEGPHTPGRTWAGRIHGLDPRTRLPARVVAQTDRVTRLALIAAERAFADAGLTPTDTTGNTDTTATAPHETPTVGVITAAGCGGDLAERELRALWSGGPRHVGAYPAFAALASATTGRVAIQHAAHGPHGTLVADQAGGLDALGHARRRVRTTRTPIAAGGFEAPLTPLGWAALHAAGTLSTAEDPARAYLPFDADARGSVPGEGGALLILEDEETARARGVHRPHAELAGHAAGFDPRPGGGRGPVLRRVIERALADARVHPTDVDLVLADAAGDPTADRIESRALAEVFGPGAVPVTAPKTTFGRLRAGGGPVDVAVALAAMAEGLIPPTLHVDPDPVHELDLVTDRPRTASVRTVLVLARGGRGFTSAVVLRSLDD
ncbi:beta-ketoacyl synthase N-terminal-like domain-containing protein (plasmid) [Streptomyces sp. BI20]|uniref:beta-ketoacyl synthase N-terminal-like domain-containing protein n=1 Tax=Streptomyces sp. BI20 TaxID=3403460 RepID=UPI003C788C55